MQRTRASKGTWLGFFEEAAEPSVFRGGGWRGENIGKPMVGDLLFWELWRPSEATVHDRKVGAVIFILAVRV
eukprot:SAG11_NODE_37993_length_254_cov_0.825806_1_plen_71_part_01